MSVPFEKLLEGVARELAHEVRFSENFQPSAEVILKRHLLPLLQAGQAMRDENEKYLDWLERLAKNAEDGAVSSRNFPSLREAYQSDAKNFRATADSKRKYGAAWDAARERLAQLEKR